MATKPVWEDCDEDCENCEVWDRCPFPSSDEPAHEDDYERAFHPRR